MPVFYNNFVTDLSTHTVSSCAYNFKSNLTISLKFGLPEIYLVSTVGLIKLSINICSSSVYLFLPIVSIVPKIDYVINPTS
jgi:hypothetical protein